MFLLFEKYSETRAKVTTIFYSQIPEDVLSLGISVDVIPEPQPGENQTSTLFVNPNTNELWYEYKNISTNDLELQQLREENAVLNARVAELESQVADLQAQLGV